jgi:hypothetical protein
MKTPSLALRARGGAPIMQQLSSVCPRQHTKGKSVPFLEHCPDSVLAVAQIRCILCETHYLYLKEFMPLLSASEDFGRRTLSAIEGVLSRLAYVIRLRDENGEYRHWGLARIHGPAAASQAVRSAHSEVLSEVLRTPLSQLMKELDDRPTELEGPRSPLAESTPLLSMLPPAIHPATFSHGKATILALRALADANRQRTSRPAA